MKTIALEQVDPRIAEALAHQRREDPILLTKGADALGLLVRLPDGTKDSHVDGIVWLDGPRGHMVVFIEAKYELERGEEASPAQPVLGSCKGMLTVGSEDDEHLRDFEDYMK